MSVFFHSTELVFNPEVVEYADFPRAGPEDGAPEKKTAPECRHLTVVLLSFILLCILQAILNILLRLTLSAPAVQETAVQHCPPGWLMFSSSCYYFSLQSRNWDDSRQDCIQRDADLVIIDGKQEQAFLTGFTEAAWVGMTDREKEGTWIWVDGTVVDTASLKWALGQPDGAYGGEDCGDLRTMVTFIGLNDFNCSARNKWICETPL